MAAYVLPRRYVMPPKDAQCVICHEALAGKTDLARLRCDHFFCFECLSGEAKAFFADSASRPTGARGEQMVLFRCPTCRQDNCCVIERIQKPSGSSLSAAPVADELGGPLREVAVRHSDGTAATWLASYYYATALEDDSLGQSYADCLMTAHHGLFFSRHGLITGRRELAAKWAAVIIGAERGAKVEENMEAFKWFGPAEQDRAILRLHLARMAVCQGHVRKLTKGKDDNTESGSVGVGDDVWLCGVVRRPEINGLEGRVKEVLPPHTQLNKSDVTRYRVSLSVCATQELSLRGDNVLRIPRAARDPLSHLVASLTGMHIN